MEKMPRILIVEDDDSVREMLEILLSTAGYSDIVSADTGGEALRLAREARPDLLLLDLMLPEISGLDVCRLLKEPSSRCSFPIIMLTALKSEEDIVRGLDIGADDYVTKPFSRQVLLARIRSQLRKRDRVLAGETLQIEGLALDGVSRSATLDGQALALTAGEFDLLKLFMKNPGRVFTRNQIRTLTKGKDWIATDRAIDVQIVNLRRKLGCFGGRIETIRGVGYRFGEETPL